MLWCNLFGNYFWHFKLIKFIWLDFISYGITNFIWHSIISFDTTSSNSQISFDFIRYQISSHLNLKSHISFDIIIIIFKHIKIIFDIMLINSRGSKLLLISFTFGENFHLQKENCFCMFCSWLNPCKTCSVI